MRYLTNGKEIFVPSGGVICKTGDAVGEDAIFYVMEGRVDLARELPDGYRFNYSVSKDGIFGVVSALNPGIHEMTATAVSNCQLYTWNKQSFETALSLYIEFAKLSIQELSRYLRAVNQEAERVWNKNVQ